MVPVIFSHGLAASNKNYTGHCRELAANGFVVIALNSHDGSCSYTEKEDGTPVRYDASAKFYDYELRNK